MSIVPEHDHQMRDTYGKLMWALMDTESYAIKSELKLNFIRPIQVDYTRSPAHNEKRNRIQD